MDQRQIQTREQSGLVESQLNEDFVYLLKTWGTWVLVVVAAASLGFVGWQRYTKAQAEKTASAFSELEAASSRDPISPESLKAIADQYQGIGSIAEVARLNAADALMRSIRTGVKTGGKVNPDGTLANAEDAMTPEDRTGTLAQAGTLYEQVYNAAAKDSGRMVLAISGAFGVAAVAESNADFAKAKDWYQRVIDLAGDGAFKPHADVAKKRIESLDTLKDLPKVYAKSEIPSLNKLPETAPLPAAPAGPVGPAIPDAAPGAAPETVPATPEATPPATSTPTTEPAPANPAPTTPPAPKSN